MHAIDICVGFFSLHFEKRQNKMNFFSIQCQPIQLPIQLKTAQKCVFDHFIWTNHCRPGSNTATHTHTTTKQKGQYKTRRQTEKNSIFFSLFLKCFTNNLKQSVVQYHFLTCCTSLNNNKQIEQSRFFRMLFVVQIDLNYCFFLHV